MKIVICGEPIILSYVIDLIKKRKSKNKYTLIVPENTNAQSLADTLQLSIYSGDYTKKYTLANAGINEADLFVALGDEDTSNYVSCMLAKKVFHVSKTISIVKNPVNVDVFTKLGVDVAVSSVHLITESIKNNATNEKILKSLSIENDEIKILEFKIDSTSSLLNKSIKDINFPERGNISAIFRDTRTIIPKGHTEIKENDKLIICCSKNAEQEIIDFINK